MSQTLFLKTPDYFDFKRTLLSHGWSVLSPFELDRDNWTLRAVLNPAKPVSVLISEAKGKLKIEIAEDALDKKLEEKILRDVRHIFRLDDDLSEFYDYLKASNHLLWIAEQKAGRLLRSPSVYEDLVKTICTTNCSWALTKIMVRNLTEKLGIATADGRKAFPTPEAMASVPVEFYKEEIRAGYRASYFKELAEKVATGQLDVENWLQTDLPAEKLKKEMKKVKGVGDYAAENLLKLTGRYDGLALDSMLRGSFYKKYRQGIICEDKEIEAHYEHFGKWRGIAIWCEMTER